MSRQKKNSLLRYNKMALTQKEINHRFYLKRKENGLCPCCGKPLDRKGFYCSDCLNKRNEYEKATRQWCKENHICTQCQKNAVYGNDKICFECRAKNAKNRKPLTEEQKKKYNERRKKKAKELYKERKQKGICVRCGKLKAVDGKTKCQNCLEKDAEMHRRKTQRTEVKRPQRTSKGICYICGKNKLYKNFGVCKKCYERICETRNHKYWKEQNKLISNKE